MLTLASINFIDFAECATSISYRFLIFYNIIKTLPKVRQRLAGVWLAGIITPQNKTSHSKTEHPTPNLIQGLVFETSYIF